MSRIRIALAAVLLAALTGVAHAADDTAGELRDRAAIEDLMWRYVRALDTLDADAYAAAFTADGQFSSGQSTEKGRAALKEMVESLKRNRAEREANGAAPTPPMYHVIANSRLQFTDADHARFESYWMTVFGSPGRDGAPRVAAVGRGVDELVRVNGEWLIQSRNVAPLD